MNTEGVHRAAQRDPVSDDDILSNHKVKFDIMHCLFCISRNSRQRG